MTKADDLRIIEFSYRKCMVVKEKKVARKWLQEGVKLAKDMKLKDLELSKIYVKTDIFKSLLEDVLKSKIKNNYLANRKIAKVSSMVNTREGVFIS